MVSVTAKMVLLEGNVVSVPLGIIVSQRSGVKVSLKASALYHMVCSIMFCLFSRPSSLSLVVDNH